MNYHDKIAIHDERSYYMYGYNHGLNYSNIADEWQYTIKLVAPGWTYPEESKVRKADALEQLLYF